jgi:hypothetical protein
MKSRQVAGSDDTITIVATEAITAKRFVAYNGTHTVNLSAMGVARFDTDSGDPISVGVAPIEVVEAGGNISAGALVDSDADGKAVTHSSGVGCGRALDAASAGTFIRVRLGVQ